MSGLSIRLLAEPVRSLAHGSILGGGAYVGIGTAIDHPARMILIQNFTDADLMCSLDGINDHFPMLNYSHLILDITSNRTTEGGGFYLSEGQRLYVTQITAPTTGSIYLTVFYGKE